MTLMRAAERSGLTLVYDTDDVEQISVSTPYDVHDLPPVGDGNVRRKLGQAHLTLRIDFKPGKRAMWVPDEEVSE